MLDSNAEPIGMYGQAETRQERNDYHAKGFEGWKLSEVQILATWVKDVEDQQRMEMMLQV